MMSLSDFQKGNSIDTKRSFTKLLMITSAIAITFVLSLSTVTYGVVKLPNSESTLKLSARHSALFLPIQSEAFFILVIGNDYRPGVEGRRADAIHLIGVNPTLNKATMLDFPRDTTVSIPGYNRNKINAANAFGGSALTALTLEQLTGVKISYILEADFAAFTGLVDELGGIDIEIEKEMRDKNSGTNFQPGTIRMDGNSALAFSRDRHSFIDGDLSRSRNQGRLLIAALAEMKNSKTTLPSRFESAAIISKHLELTNLNLRDLFFLMEQAEKIKPENITNLVVPWAGSNTLAPKANDLFADFADNAVLDTYPH